MALVRVCILRPHWAFVPPKSSENSWNIPKILADKRSGIISFGQTGKRSEMKPNEESVIKESALEKGEFRPLLVCLLH